MHDWNMLMIWFIWIPMIVLLFWLVIKMIRNEEQKEKKRNSLLELLKQKYVNGEISTEEYEERKKILEQ